MNDTYILTNISFFKLYVYMYIYIYESDDILARDRALLNFFSVLVLS